MPLALRPIIAKNELRQPLGADRRMALSRLPAALVAINSEIDDAWRILRANDERKAAALTAKTSPMTVQDLARTHYLERLALDENARNSHPFWAAIGINDEYVHALRELRSGKLSNSEIDKVIGPTLREYVERGILTAEHETPNWREFSRAIADAELEVLARMFDRDEGLPLSQEIHPPHLATPVTPHELPVSVPATPAVSLRGLLEDHLRYLEKSGRGRAARRAWPRVFEDLQSFLRAHRGITGSRSREADDATRLTTEELIAWRDEKLKLLGSKTVKDVWMASIKAVLAHAVEDRKLTHDVAKVVRVRHSPSPVVREKGFSDGEALTILEACLRYAPANRANPATQESDHVAAAKKWGPWLCAFSGARIGEIMQLRKTDVHVHDPIKFIRISPEAGTVKTRTFRDVPLHTQLIELGFLDFVASSPEGPLFYSAALDPLKLPAETVSGRLSSWLRKSGLAPDGVSPNHGWRHRFKTLGRDIGLDPRVVDAIQGHAGRTSSDAYGDVSLRAKKSAIDRLPRYEV